MLYFQAITIIEELRVKEVLCCCLACLKPPGVLDLLDLPLHLLAVLALPFSALTEVVGASGV